MKFEIKSRWTGSVLFETEAFTLKAALQKAVEARIYLKGADLEGADLEDIKNDFFARLALAKDEVPGLYDHLIRGKINGNAYVGECACFVGTIANIRKETYNELTISLKPESGSPTERWFLGIDIGDTEESSQIVKITANWMREFMKENNIPVPQYKLFSSLEKPDLFEASI